MHNKLNLVTAIAQIVISHKSVVHAVTNELELYTTDSRNDTVKTILCYTNIQP